jgi:glycosyltransferase involved in cell wall biosynthesis
VGRTIVSECVRILVLSNLYPPAAVGGYERMSRDVVERFRQRGHQVVVLTTTFGDAVDDAPGVRRALGWYWDGQGEVVCPSIWRRTRIEWTNQRALRRLLRSYRPNVVSVWGMGAASLGLLSAIAERGLPTVYVVGDDWLVYGRWADCWTRGLDEGSRTARLLARVLRLPAAPDAPGATGTFCFVSDFTRRRAEKAAGELTAAKVIPAGIDPGDFPLAQLEERAWGWRLLCVGRVVPTKGFATAIRALPNLPRHAGLSIVGSGGSHREELTRLARDIDVYERVSWTNARRTEMRHHYRAADALIFPSTGTEAFGLVPVEAMACATPVVTTAAGGSAGFLVDGENCLVVPPEAPRALADAVLRLSLEPELRRRIVAGGLQTASRLTVDRLADELEEVHCTVAEPVRCIQAR